MDQVSAINYLSSEKSSMVFRSYKFSIGEKNKDGSIRWKCSSCKLVTVTTKDDMVIRYDENKRHCKN